MWKHNICAQVLLIGCFFGGGRGAKVQGSCWVGGWAKGPKVYSIMSRPGIEPGSVQPQCTILTTVRSRPIAAPDMCVHDLHATLRCLPVCNQTIITTITHFIPTHPFHQSFIYCLFLHFLASNWSCHQLSCYCSSAWWVLLLWVLINCFKIVNTNSTYTLLLPYANEHWLLPPVIAYCFPTLRHYKKDNIWICICIHLSYV